MKPTPGSGLPRTEPPGPGWSIRDSTPYGRTAATSVIDTKTDRLIIFGGGGRDIWALALSGENEVTWQQIIPRGDTAPNHAPRSGVYDPRGNRLLMLVDTLDSAELDYDDVELWSLSLGDEPRFERLATDGEQPGAELAAGQLALDETGNRLFAVGGALDRCGAWQLSLDEGGAWSPIAGTPYSDTGKICGFSGLPGLLVFDEIQEQLLMFGYLGSYALSLHDRTWTSLTLAGRYVGDTPVYDSEHRNVLDTGGGSAGGERWMYSLDRAAWSYVGKGTGLYATAGVYDAARERLIYFSGTDLATGRTPNATWQLPIGSDDLTVLTPDTLGAGLRDGSGTVWDPTRHLAISFGAYNAERDHDAFVRDLDPAGAWQRLSVGTGPLAWRGGFYDPEARAVLALDAVDDQLSVLQLASKEGSHWTKRDIVAGPSERTGSAVVYDSDQKRLLVSGGRYDPTHGGVPLEEVWALPLQDGGAWQQLSPEGDGPGARFAERGVYDAARHRLVVLGGWDEQPPSLFALNFAGERSAWTALESLGESPHLYQPWLVMDDANERLLFVELDGWGPFVAALDFSGEIPEWHRFCSVGTPPPRSFGATFAALLDDGLFVAVGSGTFRFDLATPYCD